MKVVFLDKVHPVLAEELTANGYECIDATAVSNDELPDVITDAVGIVVRSRLKISSSFLASAKNLKFVARSGAGIENIDEEYCRLHNILIFNAPEGNRTAVAEHALGMLLALFNHLSKGNEEVRRGIWDREGNRGIEISGKTVGIIGCGNNGGKFAQLLTGFDCQILAYDKYKSNFGTERIQEATMQEIFEKADIVSFHIPQTEETIQLANSSFFQHFKKPIYVINLSRGTIVNLSDLWEAIEQKKVLGACLDVLETENKAFENDFKNQELSSALQQLLNSEKVLFSPHVGGWTHESYYKLSKVLAEKILSHFSMK